MAQCDYWWFAGEVEWCDLKGDACKCGGWQESCALRGGRAALLSADEDVVIRESYRQRNAKMPRPAVQHDSA